MEYVTLSNGLQMPQVGLGTFQIPQEKMNEVIGTAYQLGYRMFDTAWKYKNERSISEAMRHNGILRHDIFISTKCNADALYVGGCHAGRKGYFDLRNFKSVHKAIEESFRNLQTDYIDLFLVHWPWPIPIAQKFYSELISLKQEGKVRAVGVCSALPPHIDAYFDVSGELPMVNQFEISPLNTQKQLIKYCQEREIIVEAMSTFSHFRNTTTRPEIVRNQTIVPIADKYGKSVPQVILRWLVQQGVVVIPKSSNPNRLRENISIFDFDLNEEEMSVIDELDQGHFLNYNPYNTLKSQCWIRGRVPKRYRNWKGF